MYLALLELLLGSLALGDVPARREDLDQSSVGVEDTAAGPLLPPLAAGNQCHVLLGVFGRFRCERGRQAPDLFTMLGSHQREEARADAFLFSHAERTAIAVVDERARPVRQPFDDGLGLVLDDQPVTCL